MRGFVGNRLLSGMAQALALAAVLALTPAASAQTDQPKQPSHWSGLFFTPGRYVGEGAGAPSTCSAAVAESYTGGITTAMATSERQRR